MALLLIRYYHHQNITEVAEVLDRSKSNAHAYIEALRTRDLIEEVDKDAITEDRYLSKRGPKKIYQLSDLGHVIFDNLASFLGRESVAMLQNQIQATKDEYLQSFIQMLMQGPPAVSTEFSLADPNIRGYFLSVINEVMEKISFREYTQRLQGFGPQIGSHIADLMSPDPERQKDARNQIMAVIEDNPAMILNEMMEIPIYSFDDIRELGGIITSFFQQLFDYIDARKDQEKPKGTQYLYFFSGFLNNDLLSQSFS